MRHEAPQASRPERPEAKRTGLYLWAVCGVLALLGQAILRLGSIAWEALSSGDMTTLQYGVGAVWITMNAYLEGYRGFQKKFVPRVLARAHHLATRPEPLASVLAPLYAMAFFSAARRAKIAAWGVTLLVLMAITVVRTIPQPWRGVIDAGVVVGLMWGVTSLVWGAIARLSGEIPKGDPELGTQHQEMLESPALLDSSGSDS